MARPDERDEGFLARWSRRKSEESEPNERPSEAPAPSDETTVQAPQASPPEPEPEPLPDPETLGRDADWSRFLKADVPPALRARALRRLWRLDPVYANLDGLVDYAEDYNDPKFVGGPVKTLYQVGRGIFAPPEPEAAAEIAAGEPSPGEAAAAEAPETPRPTTSEPQSAQGGGEAEPASPDSPPAGVSLSDGEPLPAEAPAREEPPPEQPPRCGRGALARRWGGGAEAG